MATATFIRVGLFVLTKGKERQEREEDTAVQLQILLMGLGRKQVRKGEWMNEGWGRESFASTDFLVRFHRFSIWVALTLN